jgi:hypothetical protein
MRRFVLYRLAYRHNDGKVLRGVNITAHRFNVPHLSFLNFEVAGRLWYSAIPG